MPPLLVGAAGGIAAEVAVAILLYAGPGLARSLTTVLAVEGAALAAGLHAAPRAHAPDLVESLRRRWLFCLAAFIAAALYGTAWSIFDGLGEGRLGQGVGLALLAGLPMFSCGSVLSGMSAVPVPGAAGLRRPSAAATLGAAAGFVVTGSLLPRAPIPASLLVGCLVLLSGGAMAYGALLAAASEAEPLPSEPPPQDASAELAAMLSTADAPSSSTEGDTAAQ
jgi:hypothetical protein